MANYVTEDDHEEIGTKAVIVILIRLKRTDNIKKTRETEIRNVLEGSLAKIPYLDLENIIFVEPSQRK